MPNPGAKWLITHAVEEVQVDDLTEIGQHDGEVFSSVGFFREKRI